MGNGHGILIYSAWQGLKQGPIINVAKQKCIHYVEKCPFIFIVMPAFSIVPDRNPVFHPFWPFTHQSVNIWRPWSGVTNATFCGMWSGPIIVHLEGWAQDWRKSDGCFSPNLISSPWRRYEDYNISFCKQWKFRCHCSYEQWHLNLHYLQRDPSCP